MKTIPHSQLIRALAFSGALSTALLLIAWTSSDSTNYVWQGGPNPTPPYSSWETAAHAIQDAVDAAADGDTVLVTNGVYATGGRALHGIMTNRVAVDRAIALLSVNGRDFTIIQGYQVPGTNNFWRVRSVP